MHHAAASHCEGMLVEQDIRLMRSMCCSKNADSNEFPVLHCLHAPSHSCVQHLVQEPNTQANIMDPQSHLSSLHTKKVIKSRSFTYKMGH